MRIKAILTRTAVLASAVIVGLASAWWVLKKSPWLGQTVQVGAWKTSLLAGSQNAGLYTRASVALNGLLALGRNETIYFVATQDDAGQPLRATCVYRIDGEAPAARWWSITAYADDLFLFDAPNAHYSLNATTAALDAQRHFTLGTGPQALDGIYWLPTPGNRGLVLTLRLYNPDARLQAAPESLAAPRIARIGDCA